VRFDALPPLTQAEVERLRRVVRYQLLHPWCLLQEDSWMRKLAMLYSLEQAMDVRILHISDVQFGNLCLARPVDSTKPESIVEDPLFKTLFSTLKSRWAKPHLIALSGDITTRAAPSEFVTVHGAESVEG
jgi:hypothetical protein